LEPFITYSGLACPLNRANVDTDQIIPKQFLKRIERQGFGQFLFYHWRFHDDGTPKHDFLLNHQQYKKASILITGDNFGCGSSREHAPWSLLDYGFKVIISTSFADIFYNNCLKIGLLPVKLQAYEVEKLLENAKEPNYRLTINLEEQTVSDSDSFYTTFTIDPYRKEMLVKGWDEISLTLQYAKEIKQYETNEEELRWEFS
jgi:3-isopropylmalate/(R)-2-methylmalate dehydratase small subunit